MQEAVLTASDRHGFSDLRARRILFGLVLIYALICTPFAYYRCWYILRSSCDSAMLSQLIWATAKGYGVLYSPIWAENYLAENFVPLALLLTPVYWIIPSTQAAFVVLLFIQSLAISLCAWPAFLIARRRINDNLACMILALVTVLYPTVLSQNFYQFVPHIFGLPIILAALYFYEARRFWPYVACCVLAITAKETYAFCQVMFLPVALMQRREWKWIVWPLLFPTAFLACYFLVIAPYFRGDAPMHSGMYLSYLGDSPGEIIRRMVTDPTPLLDMLSQPYKLAYVPLLLLPLGVLLPFLGWPALLAVPEFCMNMVSSSSAFNSLRHHYGTVIGVFLCAAAVHAVHRLSIRATRRFGGTRNPLFLSFALLAACVGAGSSAFDIGDWDPLPHHNKLQEAIDMVPPDASVFCTENLILRLTYRPNVCDNTQIKWRFGKDKEFQAITRFDYIVLDMFDRMTWGPQARAWAERILRHPDYKLLWNEGSAVIFERRTKGLMDDFGKRNPEF